MIRLAKKEDAQQLLRLCNQFNGEGETSAAHIEQSILQNRQEIAVVAEEDGVLAGFVCVQMKKSLCYHAVSPEITEVFVCEEHRRKGLASKMIAFAEAYCMEQNGVRRFELQTGEENFAAQALYRSLGYYEENEILMEKAMGQTEPRKRECAEERGSRPENKEGK